MQISKQKLKCDGHWVVQNDETHVGGVAWPSDFHITRRFFVVKSQSVHFGSIDKVACQVEGLLKNLL